MRKNIVIASIVLGSVLLSGCNSEEPVEHYIGVSPEGYEDTVKLSVVKKNNYSGYFLGEGVSLETALDLSNESLNSLCYGWNWELSDKKYNGDAIKLEEGEPEELWGVEREVEKEEEDLEDIEEGEENAEDKETDGTDEVKEDEVGKAENEEDNGEEEDKKEEEPEEVETEIVVETSGVVKTLAEITGSEVILKSGQVLTILSNYIEPVEEGSTNGNEEGTAESESEGETEEKADSSEGENSEEPTEDSEIAEEEEKEPPAEVVKAITVTNYSNENRTVKSCVENGWFTLQLDNYIDCFGMKPLETEDEIPSDEVFTRLSESFGNPTVIWEQPTNSENYSKGVYQMIYAYEFPEYTLIAGVVGDSINTMYYLPKGIWLGNKEYVGMKELYSSSYIEIDKSELPEIEDAE